MNEIKHLDSKNLPKESRVTLNKRHQLQGILVKFICWKGISVIPSERTDVTNMQQKQERGERREKGWLWLKSRWAPRPQRWIRGCVGEAVWSSSVYGFSLSLVLRFRFIIILIIINQLLFLKNWNQSHSLLERVRTRSPGPNLSRVTQTHRRVQLKLHPQRLYKEGCNHLKPKRTRQLQLGWVRICQADPIRFPT